MSALPALTLGARPDAGGGVRFTVWAPRARGVQVRVTDAAGEREQALAPIGRGRFEGTDPRARAGGDYRFVLDGERVRADPASRHQPQGVHGPSRVEDPGAFRWSDTAWRGVPRDELVIYELHVGTFSPSGRFEGVAERLAALAELGVTAIELMPVAAFPGERNWGYDGVFPFAPQASYGGPEGLRRLVDAAHAAGLAVLLDVVYNHLGPEGNVLHDFGPYFTDRYRTPWGPALNFDGPDSDEVRRYFQENALHWVEEYHLDGLRLDAVHAIFDQRARPFLAELAEAIHALGARLGRRVHVIAESDDNDPRLVREPERGGLGLDGLWSDDFHHAVHAALTGEREGYYVDFGRVEHVARAFTRRFVYDDRWSEHRRRRHGAPATDVPADRFVVCVQNHDQIGNRARGERLAALLPPPRLRLAAALLLLSPYVPLLFMGEEWGETNPFLYFVDHGDPELLRAVREGRRAEFEAFAWRGPVPDPGSEESFERSRPDPARAARPPHAAVAALYRALLALRRSEPALRPGAAELDLEAPAEADWFRVRMRPPRGRTLLAFFHLGPAKAQGEAPPAPGGGAWRRLLTTEDPAFGGGGAPTPARLPAGGAAALAPEAAVLFGEEVS